MADDPHPYADPGAVLDPDQVIAPTPRYADGVYTSRPRHAAPRPVGPRRRRRRGRHRGLVVLSAVLAALVAAAGAVYAWAGGQIAPGGKRGPAVAVVIPRGSSTARIGRILTAAHVIHGAGLFRWYVELEGLGPFYAGTYHLPTNESYTEAIGTLDKPPPILVDRLVIPEGFTLHQIAARVAALPGLHLSAASFVALSTSGSVRSPLEPAHVDNLEGLLFPATYQIARTDSAASIMELLVQTFTERAQAMGLVQAAARLKLTPYQVVEVASIIQGEARLTSQFPDVASVIYNRLRSGMTLGDDSTLIYALRQKNPALNPAKVNPEQPSPYNTRLHKGLPPTPIGNPGQVALEAAMHPPTTNLLYFVEVSKSGQLGFSATLPGFDALVARCRANGLC